MPLNSKRVQAVFLGAARDHDLAYRAAILDRERMGDSELIDPDMFYLVEQGTNNVHTVNGLAVFVSDYQVISRSRLEAERTTGRFLEIRFCRFSELPKHEECVKGNGEWKPGLSGLNCSRNKWS